MTAGNHVVVGIATDVFSIEIRYFDPFPVADRNTGVPSLVPLLTDSTELQTSRPPDRVIRDQYAYLPAVSPMVDLLWTIQSSRPGVQRLADKLTIFVPLVTILAITTALGTLMIGESPATAFLTVLIIPCPCTLGLATPLAIASGVGTAARRGIIVAAETIFEGASDVEIVALDKTGTLTTGMMGVSAVKPVNELSTEDVLRKAASLERFSEHPIARTVSVDASGD